MDCVAYNSRDRFYKSVFGAIKSGEKVKYRIILPRALSANKVCFAIRKDDETDFTEHSMFWAGMHGEDHEIWDVEQTNETSGLYWYHFNLYSSWGDGALYSDENAKSVFSTNPAVQTQWQLTVYEKNFNTPDWIKGGIIYQIFPDRFYFSGEKKDNIPSDKILRNDYNSLPHWRPNENGKVLNNDYFCGDLRGIEQKLYHLYDMGVTCIYLNPIFEAHSNHRYNTADYMKIDPLLGTEKNFKTLCETAHRLNMKIILDGVFSHTGDDSVYFNKYNRYTSVGAYNSKDSKYFSWYKFEDFPDKYKSWWGFETLPEVSEECEDYLEFITGENGVIRKWLKLGADGWRLDVADELPDVFIDAVRKAVKQENPEAYLLGEVWEDATNKFSYGTRRRFLLGEQFDSVMNYPFANAVIEFARNGIAEHFASSVIEINENYPKPALDVMMNHIGTHDTQRAITAIIGPSCENKDRYWQELQVLTDEQYVKGVSLLKMASVIQYFLPGVPSVYYGDEIGMQGYKDPFNRCYFQWDNINKDLYEHYIKLGKIRKNNDCLKDGKFHIVSCALSCVAFERIGSSGSLLVIANRNEVEISYNLPGEWGFTKELLENITVTQSVKIPPMSSVVLQREI